MVKIGEYAGIEVVLTPEAYKEAIKQKTIYENEILNDLQNQNIELQERIDKAIEYISKHNCIATYEEYKPTEYEYCCNADLLDILKGDNNV